MWPDAPEWAEPSELGPEVLRDLRGLSKENSDFVARHLVAATSLADEEPEEAWVHARAARSKGGRIAVVRETVGLVAYRAQEWAEAISELRAARRMGGGPGHVAILADCERALGNPERALDLARSPEASQLDPDGAAELRIVASGARADLGQLDAAMAVLQDGPGFDLNSPETYSARLYYAYADLLLTTGDADGALEWFARADDADDDGDTDAADRIADLIAIREGRAPDADTGSGEGDADTRVAVEEAAPEEAAPEEAAVGSDVDVSGEAAGADDHAGVDAPVPADVVEDDSAATGSAPEAGGVAADASDDAADAEAAAGEASTDHDGQDGPVADADEQSDGRPTTVPEVPIGKGSVLFSSGQES